VSVAKSNPELARMVSLLEGVPLLAGVPRDLKEKLVPHVSARVVADGETFLRAGEPGDAMYIVVSGVVRVHLPEAGTGTLVELARIHKGEVIGEMALLGGEPRSADATAIGPVELVEVKGEIFRRLVQAKPEVALEMCRALSARLRAANADRGVRFGTLKGRMPDRALLDLVPLSVIRQHKVVPVSDAGEHILVATTNPEDTVGLDVIRRLLRGRELRLVAVAGDDFDRWVSRNVGDPLAHTAHGTIAERAARLSYDTSGPPSTEPRGKGSAADTLSVILLEAIELSASDIHIEPVGAELRVRFRVDGHMVPRAETVAATLQNALISRVKVLAALDITNRRLPQDGRFGVRVAEETYDIRVSTVPTLNGEKVAMRLLDSGRLERSLDALVTWERARDAIRAVLYQPSGLLLVTGPSGSGKTTTLYGALLERSTPELSIATVEDPVEYEIPGITQVPVNLEAGLDFPTAVRAFMRQSPDILLVGEMRDRHTTELTANAALTGHLVLSSFHTNDALGAISRLRDMQIEPFVLASALVGVVNQRLVRRLCPSCREPSTATSVVIESLSRAGVPGAVGMPIYRARGCPSCNGTGFKGRIGVYEVLDMEAPLRDAIARGLDSTALRDAARQGVYLTLGEYAGWLIAMGHTVPTEALRVLPMA
jgi:type II secretory ATPase GspE/PulE/Tfp pilus assembly ATPase PilB-like protein